jgi:phosphohistidine phosphatase SixA
MFLKTFIMQPTDNLFLLRHAEYNDDEPNGTLSDYGRQQSERLANSLKKVLNGNPVTIWTSSASRAKETAEIIKEALGVAEVIVEEKLWSDNRHVYDFRWLKEKLGNFNEGNLVIISHMEYVQEFPRILGYPQNSARKATGVHIVNRKCELFPKM